MSKNFMTRIVIAPSMRTFEMKPLFLMTTKDSSKIAIQEPRHMPRPFRRMRPPANSVNHPAISIPLQWQEHGLFDLGERLSEKSYTFLASIATTSTREGISAPMDFAACKAVINDASCAEAECPAKGFSKASSGKTLTHPSGLDRFPLNRSRSHADSQHPLHQAEAA